VKISELPNAEVDVSQIRQLFQNLIGNALKYHKEGIDPIVNITGKVIGGENIEVVVEDNGIGFDEKYSERIFQPFQRLHGKSEFEGTGMGLAICKKIVDRHNGTITVKSTLGKGSTFFITLPEKQASLV
jgi:two-component system, LuxR family, sensor kinase FixL